MPHCRGRTFYAADLFVLLQYPSLGWQEQNSSSNKLYYYENTTTIKDLKASHSSHWCQLSACAGQWGGIARCPTGRPRPWPTPLKGATGPCCAVTVSSGPLATFTWHLFLCSFHWALRKQATLMSLVGGHSFKSYLAVNWFIDHQNLQSRCEEERRLSVRP